MSAFATTAAAAAAGPRVLVVGDTFVDVLAGPIAQLPAWGHAVASSKPIEVLPGGCALNVASSLARLRGCAALYSGIGRDAFGDIPRNHLARLGVTLHEAHCADPAAPTGVCLALSGPEDRSLVFHSGVADQFDAEGLTDEKLAALRDEEGLRHLHVSGYFTCAALRRGLPGLLRRARACGLTTSLDPNHDSTGEWARVDGLWADVLPLLDVLLPNDLEALTSGNHRGSSSSNNNSDSSSGGGSSSRAQQQQQQQQKQQQHQQQLGSSSNSSDSNRSSGGRKRQRPSGSSSNSSINNSSNGNNSSGGWKRQRPSGSNSNSSSGNHRAATSSGGCDWHRGRQGTKPSQWRRSSAARALK